MINPQKPVINPIKNFYRFTALIYIYIISYHACCVSSSKLRCLLSFSILPFLQMSLLYEDEKQQLFSAVGAEPPLEAFKVMGGSSVSFLHWRTRPSHLSSGLHHI